MSRLPFVPVACIVGSLLAGSAAAYAPGDTLTLIWKPLPNIPAFARPGDDVTVWANAPSGAVGWQASLDLGTASTPLSTQSATWEPTLGRWNLVFRVPELSEELYDLRLTCGSCTPDIARHAVKVIPAFKDAFYFAQISDTHLPSHAFSSDQGFSTADTSGMTDTNEVIDDLNLIHPEFILHTGDLVNEGELEDYLGMYEMGRSQQMITQLRDPMFVVTGNHDIGGWRNTPPPDGTARKAWWRTFGWNFLENPPSGDPHHSQDYSFDYGLLHCIGLEAYINNGGYDSYRTDLWGKQSFTAEQMTWLRNDIAAVPAGHAKLAFYHYDFGGTLPNGNPGANFSQIKPDSLGLNAAIWGHNHGVAEGSLSAPGPFSLGLQSVIDRRVFRIFRFQNGVISRGPMHRSGGVGYPVDSLSAAWSGPNNGTLARNTATVTNRFLETWDHGRLVFCLADHDSIFTSTAGTITQTRRHDGVAVVTVDVAFPAGGAVNVSVFPSQPAGVGDAPRSFRLSPPVPNPFHPGRGDLNVSYALHAPGSVRLGIFDLGGRLVSMLVDGPVEGGVHVARWNGSDASGRQVDPGVFVVRLLSAEGTKQRKISVVR